MLSATLSPLWRGLGWGNKTPMTADAINAMLEHLSVPTQEADVEAWLDDLPNPHGGPHVVSFINAHAVNLAMTDDVFYDALMGSQVLLRDGSGVKAMMKMVGREPGMNMCGTDLIPRIIAHYSGPTARRKRIAVLATAAPWNEQAAEMIRKGGGDVVLVMDGWQEPQAYVDALKETPADLIILGMGMPKQEKVSMALKAAITHDCLIVNGGAVIDFMAGKVERAPQAWRKAGMEWAYRLYKEPRRLFGRYVVGNATFLARAVDLKLKTQEGDA